MSFIFYIIYIVFCIISIRGVISVRTSERYKEFIEEYDFGNITSNKAISELYPHINFLTAGKLELIPVDTIVQLLYMFPEDAGLAVKLVSSLQGERRRKFLMKNDREGLRLSSEVKKTIFEEIVKWKRNLGETDDFTLLYGSQFLVQASAGYLFQLSHNQATQHLHVLSNELEFANENEWVRENAGVKRTWSKLQMDIHYLSLNLWNIKDINSWKCYLEGMTLVELKSLNISSHEAKHLALNLNWSPIQYRILLDDLTYGGDGIQDLITNFGNDKIRYLIPRQFSSLPQSLKQSITGIVKNKEFQNVPLSYPSAKQMFEFELFHRNEKFDNLSKTLLSEVGPLLYTQSVDRLQQFCVIPLPIHMLSKVDSLQYTEIQSYYVMGCGNHTKSIERYFIGLKGLLKAVPSTTFMNTRINLITNELLTHLLENIPQGNVPAGAFVLNLIRLHFGKENYLKCLMKNDELLSLISPVEIANEHENITSILSKNYKSDELRSKKLPIHFVTSLLSKVNLFRWNNKSKFEFPINFLITGLTCEIISKIPPEEFMTIFAYYNRRRLAIKMDFPKHLQRCAWKAIMEYLRLKAEIEGCKSICHLISYLDKSDIKSIGGYALSALPPRIIFMSKYPHEIINEIGKLSLPELMLAVPKERLVNLTSMFIQNTVGDDLIGLNELILLGNLTHFLDHVTRIRSSSLRFILEAKMIDTRICADSRNRLLWRDAVLKAFGNPVYWESDTILTIGDLLITLSSSDLSSIPSSSMIYAADLFEVGYTQQISWFPSSMPFYKACLSMLDDSEKTLYELNILQLVRFYLLAIQNQLRSIFTASELKYMEHEEKENVMEYVDTHGIILNTNENTNEENDINRFENNVANESLSVTNNSTDYSTTITPSTKGSLVSNVLKDMANLMSETAHENNNSFTSFFSSLFSSTNENDSSTSSEKEINPTKGYDADFQKTQYESTSSKATTEIPKTDVSYNSENSSPVASPDIELSSSVTPTVNVVNETYSSKDIERESTTTDENIFQSSSSVDSSTDEESLITTERGEPFSIPSDMSSIPNATVSPFESYTATSSDASVQTPSEDMVSKSIKIDNTEISSTSILDTIVDINISMKVEYDINTTEKNEEHSVKSEKDLEKDLKTPISMFSSISTTEEQEIGEKYSQNGEHYAATTQKAQNTTEYFYETTEPYYTNSSEDEVVKTNPKTKIMEAKPTTDNYLLKNDTNSTELQEKSNQPYVSISLGAESTTAQIQKELWKYNVTKDDTIPVTSMPQINSTEVQITKELGVSNTTEDDLKLSVTSTLQTEGTTKAQINNEIQVSHITTKEMKEYTTPITQMITDGTELQIKKEISNITTDGPKIPMMDLSIRVISTTEILNKSISPELDNKENVTVIKLNDTSSGVESSSIFMVSRNTEHTSLHNDSNVYRNPYSRINREVEPNLEISDIKKILKSMNIKFEDLHHLNRRKKREIINVYDPHIKITCDALKVLKGGHELVFTLDDFANMELSQLIDCIEYLATSVIPAGQQKRYWMLLQNKVPHHLLGNILRAVTVEDLENFNFSLHEDWALETLYAFAEYTDNSTLHEAIISKFLKDNSRDLMDHSKIAWPVAISLGTILCEAHVSTIRSFLINHNNLLHSWSLLHRIKGCPITCLREIANIAITVLGNSTSWTADVFYMLGPVPAGLKENHWADLVASGENFTEYLHPSAVKCLPSGYIKQLNKHQLERMSPLAALSMSEFQRSELSKFQNETLDLLTSMNVEDIVNATINVGSSSVRVTVDKLLYAVVFIIFVHIFN